MEGNVYDGSLKMLIHPLQNITQEVQSSHGELSCQIKTQLPSNKSDLYLLYKNFIEILIMDRQ